MIKKKLKVFLKIRLKMSNSNIKFINKIPILLSTVTSKKIKIKRFFKTFNLNNSPFKTKVHLMKKSKNLDFLNLIKNRLLIILRQ
jgi:hypothetical protein